MAAKPQAQHPVTEMQQADAAICVLTDRGQNHRIPQRQPRNAEQK